MRLKIEAATAKIVIQITANIVKIARRSTVLLVDSEGCRLVMVFLLLPLPAVDRGRCDLAFVAGCGIFARCAGIGQSLNGQSLPSTVCVCRSATPRAVLFLELPRAAGESFVHQNGSSSPYSGSFDT